MNSALRLVLILLTAYLVVVAVVYLLQRNLVFAPDRSAVLPEEAGLTDVREVRLRTADGDELISWYGAADAGRETLLFFHGNGGNVSVRAHKIRQFMSEGFGVFMLGYPGYGGSAGAPSEATLVSAAMMSYEWLVRSGVSAEQVVLYGESLGSAVAVQVASAREAKALVLEAPMNSVLEIAEHQYPFLPVGLLLKDQFLSDQHIAAINMPLLVVHGSEDAIIPIGSGRKLFQRAGEPKEFVVVEGGGHNNLYRFGVAETVIRFLLQLDLDMKQTEPVDLMGSS